MNVPQCTGLDNSWVISQDLNVRLYQGEGQGWGVLAKRDEAPVFGADIPVPQPYIGINVSEVLTSGGPNKIVLLPTLQPTSVFNIPQPTVRTTVITDTITDDSHNAVTEVDTIYITTSYVATTTSDTLTYTASRTTLIPSGSSVSCLRSKFTLPCGTACRACITQANYAADPCQRNFDVCAADAYKLGSFLYTGALATCIANQQQCQEAAKEATIQPAKINQCYQHNPNLEYPCANSVIELYGNSFSQAFCAYANCGDSYTGCQNQLTQALGSVTVNGLINQSPLAVPEINTITNVKYATFQCFTSGPIIPSTASSIIKDTLSTSLYVILAGAINKLGPVRGGNYIAFIKSSSASNIVMNTVGMNYYASNLITYCQNQGLHYGGGVSIKNTPISITVRAGV